MNTIFPETAERLEQWKQDESVLGVLLVGSKSRGHGDALSDDDLEVYLDERAAERRAPADCLELKLAGEGSSRRIIYDVQYTTLVDLGQKVDSWLDLDHWPYERARVLFDRDGSLAAAAARAGAMEDEFRELRLRYATLDAWYGPRRALKTIRRGAAAAARANLNRAALALARVLFALEGRWVPLLHWLEAELATLDDPTGAGPRLLDGLRGDKAEPLIEAVAGLEERLFQAGVPRPAGREALFLELIHRSRFRERLVHSLSP